MNLLLRMAIISFALGSLATTALAGTDSKVLKDVKDIKEVAPMPAATPACDWTGFYVGLHSGGQFGHSETHDFATGRDFGYDESGYNGGLQFGYNFQWHCLVFGPEFDVGYMNLNGRGSEPNFPDVHGETDSDFYTTLRGRVGVRLNCHGCWLVYATGGAMGANYTKRYHVDPNFFDARGNDFDWGYCVGGGVEREICPHFSVKLEYLYFALNDQGFPGDINGVPVDFRAQTFGHIIRAGVNYKF